MPANGGAELVAEVFWIGRVSFCLPLGGMAKYGVGWIGLRLVRASGMALEADLIFIPGRDDGTLSVKATSTV
jgi:hypothetical protein